MATHYSVLAWRVPGTGEPGGLPFMGSHRVGPDWSNLAAAAAWLLMNIFSVVFSLISWRWESGMCRWQVVCAHTCVHVVGLSPGNAATSVCVPSHSHSLPLWETLQGKQSLLKLGLSLGFTPLFDLEIILGTEHWAYVGANLLVVGKTFAWFASASFTKCQKWKYSHITNAADSCPVKLLFISNLSLCVEGTDLLSLPLRAVITSALCVLEACKDHI